MKTYKEYLDDLTESRNYTHSIGKTISILRKWLSSYGLNYDIDVNKETQDFQLYIHNNKYFDNEHLDIILTMTENLGYYPATIIIDGDDIFKKYKEYKNIKNTISNDKQDIDYINFIKSLEFDKYDEIIFQFECYQDSDIDKDDLPDIMYHVCRTIDMNKILKYGLSPKSKSKICYHPERIYLSTTLSGAKYIIKTFKKIENIEYTILNVDISGDMRDYFKFKKDPNFDDGYYINQNINKNEISINDII